MKKRIIAMILSIVMVVGMLPMTVFAADVVASGYCGGEGDGTNLTWSLDSTGVLAISGTGAMADWEQSSSDGAVSPWRYHSSSLQKVIIEEGVSNIGDCAFYQCSNITAITIPDSVEKIGSYSFAGVSGISGTLVISSNIAEIGDYAFEHCINITSVVFENGVQKIGYGAFDSCWNLGGNINFPESMTYIGGMAFNGCRNIVGDIFITGNITFIGPTPFSGCGNITNIYVAPTNSTYTALENVVYTKDYKTLLFAIDSVSGTLNIPDTVTKISDGAFSGCGNLSGVLYIPDSVTYIGSTAFSGTKFEGILNIPDNVTYIGGSAFREMPNITSVNLPKNVDTLSSRSFYHSNSVNSVNIPDGIMEIGSYAFYGSYIDTVIFPESITKIGMGSFSNDPNQEEIINKYYFKGNAPEIYSTGIFNPNSFPQGSIIYYLEGTAGWTDSNAYDSTTNTWNGYKLECWGTKNNADNSNYTHFGQYNGSTQNYVTDPVTGLGKNLMETVTIDGTTYDVADTCTQESLYLPTDYLGNYYYIAYNLNANNEVFKAKIMPGIVCTLEGYDPTTKVVNTDYEPIIPVGENQTLPSGSFYVSDVTASSFPTDEIGSWVGDQVRIYCVEEQIFKVIHVVEGSGTITNFDALSTPQVVYIDNIPYEVIDDSNLVDTIRANIYKNANFTRYDNTIIALNGYEAVFEWNITPTINSLFLSFKIDGLYELGNGKMQIRDYKTDSIVTEISTEFFDCLYDSDDIGTATETEIAVFHEYSFDFDTEYYITVSNDFLTELHSGSPLNSYYFTNKDNSCWRTYMDVWRHHNYGDRLEKKLYTDMYGAIDGNVLYSRAKDAGTGGLCAGFVISAWSFYLRQTAANEFYQMPPANSIWDINLDSILNDVGFDADEYIKRAFILQFLPDVQEQKSKNVGDLIGLYNAVKKAQDTNKDYVYISVRGASGGHALWGHRVEDFGSYSVIYVYDCNTPEKIRELYLYGSYPNFTSFAYPDDTLLLEDEISFVTGVDDITRYLKNVDTLNLPYNVISTDATQFTVLTTNDKTATYNNAVVSGDSSVIIPVISIDTGFESQNNTIPMHWIADNSQFETHNTTSTTQSIIYSADNSVLRLDLNAQDRMVIDTTTSDAEMQMQMDVDSPSSSNITYSLLMEGKIIDITVEGTIKDNFTLTGYNDRIVISGIENPTVTMDDGSDITQRTVTSNDNDSIEIAIKDTGDDYEMDIDVTENTVSDFTITFDANGGYTTQTTVTTNSDGRISIMPTATRNGYTFEGWYTDPVNGTKITTSTVFTSNTTIYAHWTKETTSGFDDDYWYWVLLNLYNQEFNITASATEGGTITPAGVSKVKYDKNITYTITPDEGYAIADVLVDSKSVGAVSEYTIKRIKADHTIHAIFVKTAWENPYIDVSEDAWYYEDIEFVSENSLMIGTGDNMFSPSAIVNRAMLVTVLWRLEGSPVVDSPVDFYDVPADEWYTAAVNWAAANGIVNGYGNGEFGAMNDLTHEQIMAILNRYAVYKKWSENVSGTADDSYTSSEWAENNVLWADLYGMFDGIGSDISYLTEGADRAELAAYLRRFCERFMAE